MLINSYVFSKVIEDFNIVLKPFSLPIYCGGILIDKYILTYKNTKKIKKIIKKR
tara:strand:- start:201 stop:362 length:162 start_codon:yes stop_codon:yes gene_type:complete